MNTGHLILTRKKDQSFRVGADVVITIHKVDRGTVRIGITAPKEVKVLRSELVPHAA